MTLQRRLAHGSLLALIPVALVAGCGPQTPPKFASLEGEASPEDGIKDRPQAILEPGPSAEDGWVAPQVSWSLLEDLRSEDSWRGESGLTDEQALGILEWLVPCEVLHRFEGHGEDECEGEGALWANATAYDSFITLQRADWAGLLLDSPDDAGRRHQSTVSELRGNGWRLASAERLMPTEDSEVEVFAKVLVSPQEPGGSPEVSRVPQVNGKIRCEGALLDLSFRPTTLDAEVLGRFTTFVMECAARLREGYRERLEPIVEAL